jgi:integrase
LNGIDITCASLIKMPQLLKAWEQGITAEPRVERMKAGKDHRVPLSSRALAILRDEHGVRISDHVFPGGKAGKPLSNMAMTEVLRRMGRHDITVHGFRSRFRDWAAERTNFPNEVVEMALAHAVGDKVEAAYSAAIYSTSGAA